MSDSLLDTFLHYGTNAQRLAFVPDPPTSGGAAVQVLYEWRETDTGLTFLYDTAWHQIGGVPGGSNAQVQYNNASAFGGITNGAAGTVLTSTGTTTAPTFQAVPAGGISKPPNAVTTATLQLWCKADTLGLADGTAVSSWTDSSGNANHLVQSTSAAQPIFKVSIVNSLPVVRFNGTSHGLRTSTTFTLGEFLILIVCKVTTMGMLYEHSDNTNTATTGSFIYDAADSCRVKRLDVSSSANVTSGWLNNRPRFDLVEQHYGQTAMNLYRNGQPLLVAIGPIGSPAGTVASGALNFNVGARGNAGSLFVAGDLAEVIVFSGYPGSQDVNGMRTYLAAKYAIGC